MKRYVMYAIQVSRLNPEEQSVLDRLRDKGLAGTCGEFMNSQPYFSERGINPTLWGALSQTATKVVTMPDDHREPTNSAPNKRLVGALLGRKV
jgi:hypothetical protein